MKILKNILFGAIAFILLMLVLIFAATRGPVKHTKSFIDHMAAGNLEAAYMQTSEGFIDYVNEEAFREMHQILNFEDVVDYAIPGRSIQTENGLTIGEVDVALMYEDASKNKIKVHLVKSKEEGWQIGLITLEDEDSDNEVEDSIEPLDTETDSPEPEE